MRSLALPLAFSVLGACGTAGLPPVVDLAEVSPASGKPKISRIRDAGTALVPHTGNIDGVTDGSAGAGELLVIEGSGLGRQPAVTIGGRPTEVLARTSGGGIVVRIPGGVESGLVDVGVTTNGGAAHLATSIRRVAAVLAGERLGFVSVGRQGSVRLPGEISIPGGRKVRVDSTGGLAIVLADAADRSQVVVVDLGRSTPGILGKLPLSHRGAAIAVAAHSPRVVIVGDGRLSVIDTSSLRRPVLFESAALPPEVHGVRAAELSPDGRVLAVLLGEGNKVIALDVTSPTAPQLFSNVDVLPGERQSLVRDLAFSPDGQTLWVVSGASAETYPQVIPTKITALKLVAAYADGSADAAVAQPPSGPLRRMLAVWKTATIPGATAPLAIVVGHPPDASGSAIRVAPEAATVYVTAVKDALLDGKAGPMDGTRLEKLLGPPNAGMVARGELSGSGAPIVSTRELLGAFALSTGDERIVALAVQHEGAGFSLGVATVVLDGKTPPQFTPLGAIEPQRVHPPFTLGDLAIQP